MLENVPAGVGKALAGVRAGQDKIVSEARFAAAPDSLTLQSPAFDDGAPIPARYTEDGAKLSPPLAWSGLPEGAQGLALIVEDPDAPTPNPLVHCLVWDLPIDLGGLPEGELASPGQREGLDEPLGRNSFLKAQYLPPDPPSGHGTHHYVFQLFALDRPLSFDHPPTREQMVEAMQGHVLAKGRLVGTYARV